MSDPLSRDEQADRSRFIRDATLKALADLGANAGGALVATVADGIVTVRFRGLEEFDLAALAHALLKKAEAMHSEHPCDFLTKIGAAIEALAPTSRDDAAAAFGETAGHA